MAIAVVRLGSKRQRGEGVRIGTVRRPPRGVPKTDFARLDYYDAWLPELSPSTKLVDRARRAKSEREWRAFTQAYRREMSRGEASHLLDLLAALSKSSSFAVGC